MAVYKTKDVEVDVEIELADVLDFIEDARDKEKLAIQKALNGEAKLPLAPFMVPVFMRGYAGQLIALGQLEELIERLGIEEVVTRLKS